MNTAAIAINGKPPCLWMAGGNHKPKRRTYRVGARQKLNVANVYGVLILAGIVGWLTGSWTVCLIAGGVLLISALYEGGIRPTGRGR